MEGESETGRQLLTSFLGTEFYEPCKIHSNKKCTFFCFNCMGSTFCKSCNHKSTTGHNGIKVFKASNETAMCRTDMKLLPVDISEIQKYKIHNNHIVFLKQRCPEEYQCKQVPSAKYCAICRWKLVADSSSGAYIYCSIECKLKSMEPMGMPEAVVRETSTENQNIGQLMEQTEEAVAIKEEPTSSAAHNNIRSWRKRSRKGKPIRAPSR